MPPLVAITMLFPTAEGVTAQLGERGHRWLRWVLRNEIW
jgi:hypothetical protein